MKLSYLKLPPAFVAHQEIWSPHGALAGGTHARGSAHYLGLAFDIDIDIDIVNGRWVSYGSGYDVIVVSSRRSSAARVFYPAYGPYGGHGNHIHVDWLVQ